jgi:hypothetical protein
MEPSGRRRDGGWPPSIDDTGPGRWPLARHSGLLATPLIADGIDPPVSSPEVAPDNSTVACSQRARDRPVIGAGSGLSTSRYGSILRGQA